MGLSKYHINLTKFIILAISVKWVMSRNSDSIEKLKHSSEEIVCQKDVIRQISGTSYIWSAKSSEDSIRYAASENFICLNNYTDELVIRECDSVTRNWVPPSSEIYCASVPKQRNKFCPEDLTEIPIHKKFICLKILERPNIFNEADCYGSDTLFGEKPMKTVEIAAILRHLNLIKGINKFWTSVKRAEYNRYYNPFIIKLPGSRWGEVYESLTHQPIPMLKYFGRKHCVAIQILFNNSSLSYQTEITDCYETLPSVCILLKDMVTYSGCPQGFGALAYRPSECFGVEIEARLLPNKLKVVPMTQYVHKRNTFQLLFRRFNWDEKFFFLIATLSARNNISYAIEMNVKEKIRLVPFDQKQYALGSETLSNFNRKSVEMVLNVDLKKNGLILTVYNRKYIWRYSDEDNLGIKCFTNAGSEQWKSVKFEVVWQNYLETKALYKLKLEQNDGYYWCEAHTVFNFNLVKTKKVILQLQKEHTFAVLLDIQCENRECHNFYNKNTWKRLNKKTRRLIEDFHNSQEQLKDLVLKKVRLMDVASFASDGSSFQGLVHISTFLKTISDEEGSKQNTEEADSEEFESFSRKDVRVKIRNMLAGIGNGLNSKHVDFVRSTQFCFPEYLFMANGEENYWLLSKYGHVSTTSKLCLRKNGTPFTRTCQGDFIWGAYWDNETLFNTTQNCNVLNKSDITFKLQSLETENLFTQSPEEVTKKLRFLIQHNENKLIPADLYYTSLIMRSIMKSQLELKYRSKYKKLPSSQFIYDIFCIYDNLLDANTNAFELSVALNSSNILLESFERLVDEMILEEQKVYNRNNELSAETLKIFEPGNINKCKNRSLNLIEASNKMKTITKTIAYEDVGVCVTAASNFLIFVINPIIANITGVALFAKDTDYKNDKNISSDDLFGEFENESYKFLLSSQNVDSLLYENNLQLATYVPETLLLRLDEISKSFNISIETAFSIRIVIKIYGSNLFFQENFQSSITKNVSSSKIVSNRVISISIPGHDKDLPEMLPLLFRIQSELHSNHSDPNCSYWNYNSWVDDGLLLLGYSQDNNNVILCGCTHLTPFAYLIGDSYKLTIDSNITVVVQTHTVVLDVITMLGCSLSLLGILGIFLTAIVFQSWRRKASSKVLLELSAAISLQMVLICFVNTEENFQKFMANSIYVNCIFIGALLHYSVLVQFCWMLIIGYLQFKRYVQIIGNIRPNRFLRKATLVGWGVPMVPVLIVLFFDQAAYIPNNNENNLSICYPSGYSLYFAVVLPITVIILANVVIFVKIMLSILRASGENLRHTEKGLALSQLRLSTLLFFLLGLTWMFGLLAILKAGLIFSYLFCLTSTLEGLVLFIYFIILDPKTRHMWSSFFGNVCGLKDTYEATTIKVTDQPTQ